MEKQFDWFSQNTAVKRKIRKISNFQRLTPATQKRTLREKEKHKKQKARKLTREMNKNRQVHKMSKATAASSKVNESVKETDKLTFNYPVEIAAIHRDSRCIKTNRIWVQGIPMDIAQAIEIISVLKEEYGFNISDGSKDELCSQIAAIVLGPNLEKGPRVIDVIGSTSAVASFVFTLECEHQFAAVPHEDRHMTVIEIVTEAKVMVRHQSKNKKEETTISELKDRKLTLVTIPWTISAIAESELKMVLRFHSFGIDAKAELIHCIYQEITTALGSDKEKVRNFQIIPRIAFIEAAPVEVIDVVLAEEVNVNLTRIYVHFTSNANGGVRQVELSGVNVTVMAGANIIELGYRKHTPQVVYWAAFHEFEVYDTRYIIHLLKAGGNRLTDIVSVIFATPEHRTYRNVSITTERKVNARRALMDEKCTVIFTTAQALQYFIQFFRQVEVWKEYPQTQIGFMDTGIQLDTLQIGEQYEYISLNQYKLAHKLFHYPSNEATSKQEELQTSRDQPMEMQQIHMGTKCLSAVDTLKKGMKDMPVTEFKQILDEICASMNLQIKTAKGVDSKRGIAAVNQEMSAAWGGAKHSARLEQKTKGQPAQDMEVQIE